MNGFQERLVGVFFGRCLKRLLAITDSRGQETGGLRGLRASCTKAMSTKASRRCREGRDWCIVLLKRKRTREDDESKIMVAFDRSEW